jgi:hypothetical protein
MRELRLAAIAALLAAACGGTRLERVPLGDWGGEHVGLTVEAAGATATFDCAHGQMQEPLLLDREGHFDVNGVFVRERGGPVREGEAEDAHPARYSGTTNGAVLRFEIALSDTQQILGPFTAVYGSAPRIFRCLAVGPS